VKQTLLRMALVAGVLLAGVERVVAQDAQGQAEVLALYRRGQALQQQGKWAEAIKVYEQALAKAKDAFGPTEVTTAALANNLANVHYTLGQYAKAESLCKRSLEVYEAKLGKDHPQVASILNNLAELYRAKGQHAQAEPLYQRSLAINEARVGKDEPATADSLKGLALLYKEMGQHARAEPLFRRSIQIYEAKLGKDHLKVAYSLHLLGSLYKDMGQYARAEPLFQRGLAIFEAKLGKDHPHMATSLNNLAALYADMGQHAKAEPLYQRGLAITEARLGKDHPDVAAFLNNLAQLSWATGAYAKAEPLYRRSLEIYEAKLGKDHPLVAAALNNLAALYKEMGQLARAEPLFQRSLEIREARLGKDHPDVAAVLNNLAALYQDSGEHAKAEPLYRRSLSIWEAKLGKDHPDVAASLNNLAGLCVANGEVRKAFSLFDRARRGARRHVASVLPSLSDADKAAFFKNTTARNNLEMALSLGLARHGDADLAAQSATWLLNGKAIDQESLASSVLLSRQSGDPALGKLSSRLLAARQHLARLTFSTPRPGQEKQRLQQIEELTGKEQQLVRTLRQSGSKAALPDWIELAEVRKGLPADAVLIDAAHFNVFDFKAKRGKQWQAPHYAAWVTPKYGLVRLIDLGPADKIDAAIKQFREAVQNAGKRVREQGEEQAEKAIREHLDVLSALVLKPLLPHMGKARHLLVSPDGNLWLLPWEALTLEDGRYAIEEHRISYLTSGRDLVPAPAAKVKVSAPLVLADPDFDLDAGRARGAAGRLVGRAIDEGAVGPPPGGFRLGTVKRLLATAGEARAITPSLKQYAGIAPRVHTQAEALEAVFKAARSPRVVVLSTHGFFLPDQELPREGDGKPRAARRWENPLLRCGLLLAGCNNAAKASDGDDGVLTGLEVVGTDLRGTDLVVLSACETGLGEVQSGEGVSGLRQAFQLAGARAVVSTLWRVPDKQSARLMALFFENLSKGMRKAEALRAAKVKLIEERREDYAAAHPFFWAAFTLTGQP
jgi:CHAT domain-containing protein/Tfp pilus assembly protein PilF